MTEESDELADYMAAQQRLIERLIKECSEETQRMVLGLLAEGKAELQFELKGPPMRIKVQLLSKQSADSAVLFSREVPEEETMPVFLGLPEVAMH